MINPIQSLYLHRSLLLQIQVLYFLLILFYIIYIDIYCILHGFFHLCSTISQGCHETWHMLNQNPLISSHPSAAQPRSAERDAGDWIRNQALDVGDMMYFFGILVYLCISICI